MSTDRLAEMIFIQCEQQCEMYGEISGDDQRRELGIQLATYMGEEVYDYLNQLGFKHYLPPIDRSEYARKMEVIDLLKYTLALAWVEGMDALEVYTMFCDKTATVRARDAVLLMDQRIAAVDIDGVLADIAQGGYDSGWTIEEQDAWHLEGNIASLQPIYESIAVLQHLRIYGWQIVLVTSRKRHRHKAIESQTYAWLETYKVPYDKVLWGHDKAETMAEAGIKPTIYIDDSPKHAIDVAMTGIKTYLMGHPEVKIDHPMIRRIDNLLAIDEMFEQVNQCLGSTESNLATS